MKLEIDLTEMRERLIESKIVLNDQIETERKKVMLPVDGNLDQADQANDYAFRAHHISLLEQLETRLEKVNKALERMDAGTYGICENCGRAILTERLEALPHAELCIDCQQQIRVV